LGGNVDRVPSSVLEAVHTVGGVVTPARPLMMVVPDDNPLEAGVFVENKDIGFVRAGQEAEI
jgi:hemolysin D